MKKRSTIGASDVPAILGLSTFRTPLDVYLALTEGEKSTSSASAKRGLMLEPVIVAEYCKRHLAKVQVNDDLDEYGLPYTHKEYPFFTCSLDGIFPDSPEEYLECKSTIFRDQWGEPGTDEVPICVMAQVQAQMAVAGKTTCYIPVLFLGSYGNMDYEEFLVRRDHDTISAIERIVCDFWNNHILQMVPPPFEANEHPVKLYGKSTPASHIDANYKLMQQIKDLKIMKLNMKRAEIEYNAVLFDIQKAMKDAEEIRFDGKTVAVWKNAKPSKKFDMEAFKECNAEIYREFLKDSQGARRFLLKGENL